MLSLFLLAAGNAFAQGNEHPKLDVGFSASTLGFGANIAAPVYHRGDVRGGFNFYNYNRTFSKDGANYGGKLSLRSVSLEYDQYVAAGFHVSGGALLWNGNKGDATLAVAVGKTFTLGGTTYSSDATNPISGAATLRFKKAAPMIGLGYGNLASKGHFAYSVDTGVIFQGSPRTVLSLAGNACTTTVPSVCQNAATTAAVQANVTAEQTKVNSDLKPFKYYPVIQLMIGYKF